MDTDRISTIDLLVREPPAGGTASPNVDGDIVELVRVSDNKVVRCDRIKRTLTKSGLGIQDVIFKGLDD